MISRSNEQIVDCGILIKYNNAKGRCQNIDDIQGDIHGKKSMLPTLIISTNVYQENSEKFVS